MNLYNLVLYVHIASLCIAVFGIAVADKAALSWMRGRRSVVGRRTLFVAHWLVSAGLVGLLLSGAYLFWPLRAYLLGQPLFWLKMIFVAALVLNSFVIEYLMHTASYHAFSSLSRAKKIALFVSGGVSTISWLGAFFSAFALF